MPGAPTADSRTGEAAVQASSILETPSAPSQTVTSSQTTEAARLEVLSHNVYIDLIGYMHIVGEVANRGTDALTFVEVVASLYDAQGILVGAESTYASLDILPPGEVSPFHIISLGDSSNVETYKLQAQGDSGSFTFFDTEFIEVVSSSDFTDQLGYQHIVGEVENTSDRTLTFVEIVATVYDAAGEVVAADFTYASLDRLAPGSTSPFEIILLNSAGEAANYRLIAQGTPE